jgi:hypothetical protein
VIYFVQQGTDGPIKIGVSTDPEQRLRTLQSSSPQPLTLLAFMPGGVESERDLHRRFADGRLEGEWFRSDTPGLADEIARSAHGQYLIDALGEADEKAASWKQRRDEIVEEIVAFCAERPIPTA